jgi:hypothetical protein
MAKKPVSKSKPAKSRVVSPVKVSETPVRNSAIPKTRQGASNGAAQVKATPMITYDMVAMRAFDIWRSGTGGDDYHNWVRAEEELRRELGV